MSSNKDIVHIVWFSLLFKMICIIYNENLNFRLSRRKEFLVRMNIASYETKIPNSMYMRICSKHFKEDDLQVNTYKLRKKRKYLLNVFPIHWKDLYPDEVELVCMIFSCNSTKCYSVFFENCIAHEIYALWSLQVEARTSFRLGDDILEFIEEQRESVGKVKIEVWVTNLILSEFTFKHSSSDITAWLCTWRVPWFDPKLCDQERRGTGSLR